MRVEGQRDRESNWQEYTSTIEKRDKKRCYICIVSEPIINKFKQETLIH